MKSYSEKLKDPRWQKIRLEILERDEWACVHCLAKDKTLHVHHLIYKKGMEPWEYDESNFVSLCEDCHLQVEDIIELTKLLMQWPEFSILLRRITNIACKLHSPIKNQCQKINEALDSAVL